jgi:ribosomal protein S18 acetylase RimI-like enzyme
MFLISLAAPQDVEEVVRLRHESADWLATLGTDQWQQPWPTPEDERKRLNKSFEQKTTWIVKDRSKAVATFAIDTFSDPHLWEPEEQAERALYIHRFIVDHSYSGVGLGARLVDLIDAWAAHDDYRWLRVDVWTTNTRLHKYYERIRFSHVRTIESDYPSGALFQRKVTGAT